MSARRKTSLIAGAVLVVSLAVSVTFLAPLERAQHPGGDVAQDVLYIPSARALRAMSLGYDGLAADIYWTRAVQYFGRRHQSEAMSYPLLAPLLQLTTDLDPHMIVAYQFGGTFLAP